MLTLCKRQICCSAMTLLCFAAGSTSSLTELRDVRELGAIAENLLFCQLPTIKFAK